MIKYLFHVIFVWSIAVAGIYAQQKTDSLYYQLDSVVVSAGRYEQPLYQIPFSIDIISGRSLYIPNGSLSGRDLFRFIPGVIVDDRNNLSEGDRISIRGIGSRSQFGVRGIKILLDGIPLTFPDGQSQLNNLDFNSIGSIQVIRGPSSFLYGNSAGGVIEIQSKDIYLTKLKLTPGFRIGSFGLQKYSFYGADKIGKNMMMISINKINYSGFRENSAASSAALNIISTQQFENNLTLEGIFNYYDAPYLLNPGSLTKSDAENNPTLARTYVKNQGAGKNIKQGQAGATLTYKPDNLRKLEATVYGISRSMLNPIPGRYINLNRISGGFRTDYSTYFKISNKIFDLLSGGDYEFQNDQRREYENNGVSKYNSLSKNEIIKSVAIGNILLNQREKVSGFGIFSRLGFSPYNKIYVTAGLRYDDYLFGVVDNLKKGGIDNSGSISMNNLSRMAGITYRIGNNNQVYANYSTSFQTPTTSELSNSPTGQSGFNTHLKPEQITNYELGIRGELYGENLVYGISIYHLNIGRILISYQLPGSQSDQVFYRNSGSAVNNGVELNLNYKPDNNLNFSFAYTYMDFKFQNFIEQFQVNDRTNSVQIGGKRVPGIPPNNISLGAVYSTGFGLTAQLTLNWTDKYFTNDVNGPEPGSELSASDYVNNAYSTADLKFVYRRSFYSFEWKLYLGIINFFDKKYNGSIVPNAAAGRYFEPAAPRNLYGGLSINF